MVPKSGQICREIRPSLHKTAEMCSDGAEIGINYAWESEWQDWRALRPDLVLVVSGPFSFAVPCSLRIVAWNISR